MRPVSQKDDIAAQPGHISDEDYARLTAQASRILEKFPNILTDESVARMERKIDEPRRF